MSLESLDRAMEGTVDLSVGDIVAKYGSKQAIAMAVQKGEIPDVTKAVMAGMAIDRITASAMQPPTTTVAQDVFTPPQPTPQMGLAAAQQMQGQPAGAGLDQIPVPEQMFNQPQGMAGGGIVAFQTGNLVRSPKDKVAAYYQSLKDFNPSEFRGIKGAELSAMMRETRNLKIDPVTGNPISLGDFIRAVDSGKIKIPEDFSMTPTAPSFAQNLSDSSAAPAVPVSSALPQQFPPGTKDLRAPVTIGRDGLPVPVIPQETSAPRPQPGPQAVAVPTAPSPDNIFGFLRDPTLRSELKNMFGNEPAAAQKSLIDEMKEQGFDPLVYSKAAGRLAAQKEELKKDRTEAANMRLIEAGLSILGGESPYAFVNIGKGAAPAMQGFAKDIKEIQKNRRELDKIETELQLAQNQLALNVTSANRKEVADLQARKERYNQTFGTNLMSLAQHIENNRTKLFQIDTQARIERERINKPSQLRELIELAAGDDKSKIQPFAQAALSTKSGPKPMSQYERARLQQNAMKNISEDLAKSSEYRRLSRSNKPEDKAAAEKIYQTIYTRHMGAISGGSNLGGAVFVGYGDE